MQVEPGGIAVTTPAQAGTLVNRGVGRLADIGRQVLEIVRVADVGVIDLGQQAVVETMLVLPAVHPAIAFVFGLAFAFFFLVITQPGSANAAFAFLGQVTEFTLGQQAALTHVVGVKGGIHMWRQVDVVRGGQVQSLVIAITDAGRQKT